MCKSSPLMFDPVGQFTPIANCFRRAFHPFNNHFFSKIRGRFFQSEHFIFGLGDLDRKCEVRTDSNRRFKSLVDFAKTGPEKIEMEIA